MNEEINVFDTEKDLYKLTISRVKKDPQFPEEERHNLIKDLQYLIKITEYMEKAYLEKNKITKRIFNKLD